MNSDRRLMHEGIPQELEISEGSVHTINRNRLEMKNEAGFSPLGTPQFDV